MGVRAAGIDGGEDLNYHHVFVRDFACCAPAFLSRGREDVVRNFLVETLELQAREETFECQRPGRGLMPASFRPVEGDGGDATIAPDFGEESIARVTPIDSVFWWLITLRAYEKATGDQDLGRQQSFQDGVRRILDLALEARFELQPTLLCPDGSFMIDRRMGVYGHPLEAQCLFFLGLRAARQLLAEDDPHQETARARLGQLAYHLRRYYWLDSERLDGILNGDVESYGRDAANAFNIYPDTVPQWAREWVPEGCGYFAGNVGPGRLDCRFYLQGNLLACLGGLATEEQSAALLDLIEAEWDQLAGDTPFKLCYPALEDDAWRIITGADPKNKPWSYHNGGSWPFLAWSFALFALRSGRRDLVERVADALERRLPDDNWPEYYEGLRGERIGESARSRQSWTLAGYLNMVDLLDDPDRAAPYQWDGAVEAEEC